LRQDAKDAENAKEKSRIRTKAPSSSTDSFEFHLGDLGNLGVLALNSCSLKERTMKYLCMGFHDEKAWAAMDPIRRNALTSESLEFASRLRNGGHVVDSRALKGTPEAVTLRFASGGHMAITDGPFAETKEQLGGLVVLEAADLNQAIQLMSQTPCMRAGGSIEIRPINEDVSTGAER
jgi:hypothetical protein